MPLAMAVAKKKDDYCRSEICGPYWDPHILCMYLVYHLQVLVSTRNSTNNKSQLLHYLADMQKPTNTLV